MNARTLAPVAPLIAAAALLVGGCMKDDTPRVKQADPQSASQLARSANVSPTAGGATESARGTPAAAAALEPVALFTGPMPTGVAVSSGGRVFVNFPRWGDPVEFTVAEVKGGNVTPFPDLQTNKGSTTDFADKFVSVQSVVIDPADRLWVLDTGNLNFGPTPPNAGKLVCYDLQSNKQVKSIAFPSDVALATTYLNDVRFDLTRGPEGFAYITDSSNRGPNGIIVVDLASGKSWRRLHRHKSVEEEPNFIPTVEGQPFAMRPTPGSEEPIRIGSDGIAISPDGKTLYYTALAGRHLYSVSTDALADPNASDADVAKTVKDLGDRGFASDGMESDAQGRVYLTDYENNAVRRLDPQSGSYTILAQDPRLIWPDSMSLTPDGYLYVTANQLNRQAPYQEGKDKRQQPYALFRVKTDGRRITQQPGAGVR